MISNCSEGGGASPNEMNNSSIRRKILQWPPAVPQTHVARPARIWLKLKVTGTIAFACTERSPWDQEHHYFVDRATDMPLSICIQNKAAVRSQCQTERRYASEVSVTTRDWWSTWEASTSSRNTTRPRPWCEHEL